MTAPSVGRVDDKDPESILGRKVSTGREERMQN
jgi:hypothetical protein